MNIRKSQTGVGLIEVLIAVLVLAIGLLGIAALQAVTLKNSGGSAERTQAVIQTYSMLDLLRANKDTATTFNTGGAFQCGTYTPPEQNGVPGVANGGLNGWLAALKSNVSPSACGKVVCAPNGSAMECTITTRWDASRSTGGRIARSGESAPATGEADLQKLETRARL